MLLPITGQSVYWSRILNAIIQTYLINTTICIVWHDAIEFVLDVHNGNSVFTIVSIDRGYLNDSFDKDIADFNNKRSQLLQNDLPFDEFVEKLTMSIEMSHCETFIAFDQDIPIFVEAFTMASAYSIWRSTSNKFVFAYNGYSKKCTAYFQHFFFQDQANILLVEAISPEATFFNLKTNKYVGPRSEKPETLFLLDSFDGINGSFLKGNHLFPNKLQDLQGREVIIAPVDYKPAVVLDYDNRDLKYAKRIDGTEARIVIEFCKIYNCTIKADYSQASDWGMIYPNMSGDGALGLVIQRNAEMGIGAMYTWKMGYIYLDLTMFLVRTGITLIVPAPRRLASWLLPLEPFALNLWIGVLIMLVVEAIGLFLAHKCERVLSNSKNSWFGSLKFGVVLTFKLLISQSGQATTTSMTVRVFLFACFLNDLIITSIYGGGLASILTIPSFEEAADSVERLRTHDLKWAADSEAWVLTIKDSDEPHTQKILSNFAILSDEELMQKARTEYMGFTVERLQFGHFAVEEFLNEDVLARFKIMEDDIYFEYTVAFVSRCWPLLEQFNLMCYMWHSSGFDKLWEWRIVVENLNVKIQKQVEASEYINSDEMGAVKLGLSNFAGILLIWVLGIGIAVVVFIIELLTKRFENKLFSTKYLKIKTVI